MEYCTGGVNLHQVLVKPQTLRHISCEGDDAR